MFRGKDRRFTSAHAIAIAALFFALGGGAYAAVSSLPPNSVGTKQLQNGSVTEEKLAPGAFPKLTAREKRELKKIIKSFSPKAQVGPAGPPGPRGATGESGPSDVYIGGAAGGSLTGSYAVVVSIQVPPGDYLIQAKTEIFNGTPGEGGEGGCEILPDLSGGAWDAGSVALPAVPGQFAAESLALTGAASLPNGGSIALACKENAGALSIDDARVWATKVGSLHGLPVPVD
jgi:hypothetical protein